MSLNEPQVDFHLQLQSYSFNVPYEGIKKNFKTIRKLDEKQFKRAEELINDLNKPQSKAVKLAKLKQLINSTKLYERKIKICVKTEDELLSRIQARILKLNELRDIQKDIKETDSNPNKLSGSSIEVLNDTNRERLLSWYRNQTNLLICDYLLKNNHLIENNPGLLLLKNLKSEKLIDYDMILTSNEISAKILKGDLSSLINWIDENKSYLNKIKSGLEFETRFQEYIECVKANDINKSLEIFNTYLTPFSKTNFTEIKLASGLLTFIKKIEDDPTNEIYSKYIELLKESRYEYLSRCFLGIFHLMNGLPLADPLLVYLSMGISSLKTRSCICGNEKSKNNATNNATDFENILNDKLKVNLDVNDINKSSNACPVCSSEFRLLSKDLRYSHNTKSFLFDNPVMLPNGNIFDKEKLVKYSSNDTSIDSLVEIKDPITHEIFESSDLITMYPT